jgi:hypothetical protein
MPGVSLSDATLKAVQAHDEERHRQRGSQLSLTAIRHDGPAEPSRYGAATPPPCRPARKPRSALVPAAVGVGQSSRDSPPTRGYVRTEDARGALQQRRPRILMAVPGRERAAPKLLYLYGGTESLNLSCSDSEVGLLSERLRREPRATGDNITGVALKNVPAVRVKASARRYHPH